MLLLFLSRKNEDPRVDSPDLLAELEIRYTNHNFYHQYMLYFTCIRMFVS